MEAMTLVLLLAIAFGVLLVAQTLGAKSRQSSEDKVLKGYFLLGLSGLMAKIAMADGSVAASESALATRIFERMDLTSAERAMCIGNFVTSLSDGFTPRDHAKRFLAYANHAACEFLYDLLWRISRADGVVAESEDTMLREIAAFLGLSESDYSRFKAGEKPSYSAAELKRAGVPASLVKLVRN